jgi:hypothetical protein
MRSIRSGIDLRTSASKRARSLHLASSGMTLKVVPLELADREDGRILRRDLAADDRLQHRHEVRAGDDRIDGSCGIAPWPPLPRMSDRIRRPRRRTRRRARRSCRRRARCRDAARTCARRAGSRARRPRSSSSVAGVPSSPGWKQKTSVPGTSARRCASVLPPRAGSRRGRRGRRRASRRALRDVRNVVQLDDRQRVHVGAQQRDRAGFPPRSVPSTPVLPTPVRISSSPSLRELGGDEGRRLVLDHRELGPPHGAASPQGLLGGSPWTSRQADSRWGE